MILNLKTILFCILTAIGFGIVHDLITANICVEYFTIGHPKIIESENPFLLALLWGVIATWWVGLILGIFIVVYNIIGKSPSLPFATIKRFILKLIFIMPFTSLLAGIIGYVLARMEVIHLVPCLAKVIPEESRISFLAVGWAHISSYLVGLIGGIVICAVIWNRRSPLKSLNRTPRIK